MKDNLYFDNVVQIGKMYLEHVFYGFESEPILFTCTDEAQKLYLCLCSDIRYGQKWIIVECSIMKLKELIEEETDIASVFLSASHVIAINMDLQGNESSAVIERDQIDRLDLPKEGTYIRCDKQKAANYLWNKEREAFYNHLQSMLNTSAVIGRRVQSYTAVISETIDLLGRQMEVYSNTFSKINAEAVDELGDMISQPVAAPEYSIHTKDKYSEPTESVNVIDAGTDDFIQAA